MMCGTLMLVVSRFLAPALVVFRSWRLHALTICVETVTKLLPDNPEVERILREARVNGRVGIVTLAQRPWVPLGS